MISIIIPTYNHAPELEQCLASVSRQTYQDFEIIVVDDGSIDYPEEIVKKYSNLTYIKQDNAGANAARNRGFELARGEYAIFLDADIVMRADMLEKMHRILAARDDLSFVYSAYKIGVKTMRFVPFDEKLLRQFNYIHTSSMLRSRDFPGFDEGIKKFQDWDLWLTMLANGKKGKGINEVLFKIINPTQGTMSVWLPKFVYRLPWPIWGYIPAAVKKYNEARQVIIDKHHLSD